MATLTDIANLVATLTTQEAGEQVLAAGQVAVDQSVLDSTAAGLTALIDAHAAATGTPAPTVAPTPAPAVDPNTGLPVAPSPTA